MVDRVPRIVGDGWAIFVQEDIGGWRLVEPPGEIPPLYAFEILKMVNGEFPPKRIEKEYHEKHTVSLGTKYGPLYEDTLDFLHKSGVKCKGVNIPKYAPERGPYDENNPPPAE